MPYGEFKFEINDYVMFRGYRVLIVDRWIDNFHNYYLVSHCTVDGCGISQAYEYELSKLDDKEVDKNDR